MHDAIGAIAALEADDMAAANRLRTSAMQRLPNQRRTIWVALIEAYEAHKRGESGLWLDARARIAESLTDRQSEDDRVASFIYMQFLRAALPVYFVPHIFSPNIEGEYMALLAMFDQKANYPNAASKE
jgi:hypothetical protein